MPTAPANLWKSGCVINFSSSTANAFTIARLSGTSGTVSRTASRRWSTYHRLDTRNLERLIHTYLGDWIRTQEQGVQEGVDGAQIRLAAARNLKARLELILEGEGPYDIFVRWKPLDQQPIGWNPDLNDGVRLNIRPFMTAEVLRHNKPPKLNVKWDKDRGKDVESAPWFHRYSRASESMTHHLTLAEKSHVIKRSYKEAK
jgi:hypothetical protein